MDRFDLALQCVYTLSSLDMPEELEIVLVERTTIPRACKLHEGAELL